MSCTFRGQLPDDKLYLMSRCNDASNPWVEESLNEPAISSTQLACHDGLEATFSSGERSTCDAAPRESKQYSCWPLSDELPSSIVNKEDLDTWVLLPCLSPLRLLFLFRIHLIYHMTHNTLTLSSLDMSFYSTMKSLLWSYLCFKKSVVCYTVAHLGHGKMSSMSGPTAYCPVLPINNARGAFLLQIISQKEYRAYRLLSLRRRSRYLVTLLEMIWNLRPSLVLRSYGLKQLDVS
jgi:hypothetical protein